MGETGALSWWLAREISPVGPGKCSSDFLAANTILRPRGGTAGGCEGTGLWVTWGR